MATNVLIIGSGGREHALGWKLKQSKHAGKIYFAPGNGGTAAIGENVKLDVEPVNTKNAEAIDYFCRQNKVGLIVIGPEDPLAHGLADRLQRDGRYVFGPVQAGARLEGDKAFAKQLMRAASIPTAEARIFTDYEAAIRYVENHETPVVVKAAGLAKGKGAIVCDNQEQAIDAVNRCMKTREFGDAGNTVVIEERLVGQEVSILALVDGKNIYVLDPSQDHKQVNEGDTGPNTGGMGAYCPTPLVDDAQMTLIQREVLVPTVDAMRRDGITFQGVLYAGLMLTAGGPKVLEYNTRFGDPECQPLMMRLKGDLFQIMTATCDPKGGRLHEVQLDWDKRVACCVVMCSGGYPGKYETGIPITGIEDAESDPDVKVFHAGTKLVKGELVTAGGRVLNVTAMGKTLKEAQEKANAACDKIQFRGAFFRRDIGNRVMK
ncbi:phosphoribosylamine--glycine ligase [Phycisphaerales bacterium AB-hyl4]|uniref:Phosphoribosylamine--glycine ligase n=1 Tax=Natronomicrosphaera hydrolytica TaxID=3242702 RepID=A0ABV4U324_9BACT